MAVGAKQHDIRQLAWPEILKTVPGYVDLATKPEITEETEE